MRDLVFAAAWAVLVPAALLSADVGVLVWVWVALLSPNELLYGFMAAVPFNKVATGATLASMVVTKQRKDFYFDKTMATLLLLAVTATISWLGALVASPLTDDLYQKLLKIIVLAFAIAAVMHTRERIHALVFVIVLALSFLGVKEGLIYLLTAGGHKVLGSGSIGDNNSLATALLMIVPLAFHLSRYTAVRAVRIGLLVVLGLSVVTVVATYSRGGFIGLLLLGLLLVKNSPNKLRSLLLIVVAGALVYFLAPAAWFERIDTIKDAGNDGSFMGRVVAWKISWLIAMAHPLFGGGPHAVQQLAVWSTFRPLLDTLDFIPTPPADEFPHAAHSTYFEVLGDLGFVGLAVFLSMLGTAFWNCRKIRLLCRGDPALAWAGDLAHMLQASLLVYAVTTAALSMGYFELLYVLVALSSRCLRTVQQSRAAQPTTANAPTAGRWQVPARGRQPVRPVTAGIGARHRA